MSSSSSSEVRLAGRGDADAIGRLLYAFNREFGEPAPELPVLAARMRQLLDGGDTLVLLAGDGPDGLAVLRFRPAIWSAGLECYLAELYVTPARRAARAMAAGSWTPPCARPVSGVPTRWTSASMSPTTPPAASTRASASPSAPTVRTAR